MRKNVLRAHTAHAFRYALLESAPGNQLVTSGIARRQDDRVRTGFFFFFFWCNPISGVEHRTTKRVTIVFNCSVHYTHTYIHMGCTDVQKLHTTDVK